MLADTRNTIEVLGMGEQSVVSIAGCGLGRGLAEHLVQSHGDPGWIAGVAGDHAAEMTTRLDRREADRRLRREGGVGYHRRRDATKQLRWLDGYEPCGRIHPLTSSKGSNSCD